MFLYKHIDQYGKRRTNANRTIYPIIFTQPTTSTVHQYKHYNKLIKFTFYTCCLPITCFLNIITCSPCLYSEYKWPVLNQEDKSDSNFCMCWYNYKYFTEEISLVNQPI